MSETNGKHTHQTNDDDAPSIMMELLIVGGSVVIAGVMAAVFIFWLS